MSRVEIRRDRWGIAHVRAGSLADALWGQGYAAATDRLFQMTSDRAKAMGRWASWVGPVGVASDRFHLSAGIGAAARRDLEHLGSETRDHLDAYTAGVNAAIADMGADGLPAEHKALGVTPEPWQAHDSLAVYKVRHLLMGTAQQKAWRSAIARRDPDLAAKMWPGMPVGADAEASEMTKDALAALSDMPAPEAASNNVAVGPTRSRTGAPLLAGDPHRAFDVPNVYWQNHLSGGGVDVIGLSFPGVPGFPHFAHNDSVAWCITHGMADDQDLFIERLSRDGDRVVAARSGGPVAVAETTYRIEVAGGEPVEHRALRTDAGPVVAADIDAGWGVALAWTGEALTDTTFDALVPMMKAGTVAELDEAMRPWVIPVNNVLMADTDGSIAYRMRGRLVRRDPLNGWVAVPADDPRRRWNGEVNYDDQPLVVDPNDDYLVTANEPMFPRAGLYVSNDHAHPARSRRIHQLVRSRHDWSASDISDVLTDTRSLAAGPFVELIERARPSSAVERVAAAIVSDWDGHLDAESTGAAIYVAFRVHLIDVLIAALGILPDGFTATSLDLTPNEAGRAVWMRSAALLETVTDDDLAGVGGWAGAATVALRNAVRHLTLAAGPSPAGWRWGDLHTTNPVHPLAAIRPDLADATPPIPRVGVGGDADCPLATSVMPPSLAAARGPVARYVFDLADWERSRWAVPLGVSGVAGSHHADQADAWSTGAGVPMVYGAAAVEDATVSVTTLDVS